ncbi:germinal-center associated nuclear protein-like, partial [Saccostrea cucullata]|uniref:germinal-center associated nuclear protein-like n=1 Tax=Saccostrea cuccullata TaxID=36930 RepID=UPI002ED296DB
ETQQLRPEVWNSTLINYALKVYAALNSNNYVRFFRLVREGSFLCSCILHRYFTQVRKKALYILVKAHHKGVQLPLEDLVRSLSFDDQSEAAHFCQFFGLTTVDNCVTLDKATFIEPEENWCPQRSALIERKLNTSIGEAIYGGPLPAFSLPEPENSFDNNGKYIGQIIIKDSDFVDSPRKDAVRGYNVPDQTSVSTDKMAVPQPTVAPKVKVTYTNEEVKETAKFLFWEVIDIMCLEIGQEAKREVDKLMDISQSLYDSITGEVFAESVS